MAENRVRRALISVSDKTGVIEFAKGLVALGVEVVSTGGTHKALTGAGVPAVYISEVTGFPEIMDGRVKTLHPAIHGAILARRNDPSHRAALEEQGITAIDLVAVNLYPFEQVANCQDAHLEDLIENIDIGGPAMVRSAAKNYEDVIVVVDPTDYADILFKLETTGDCDREERMTLARKAFRHTAEYDACIHGVLAGLGKEDPLSQALRTSPRKVMDLRYGENPGQAAALYRDKRTYPSFVDSLQIQGKELSYNNWLDADSAFRMAQEFETPAAIVVKHTNPCGAAIGETVEEAFQKAYAADPLSAYGGIVALNRPMTRELALAMQDVFWEVILAPDFSGEACSVLQHKKNLRLLKVPQEAWTPTPALEWRSIQGGFLVQERDLQKSPLNTWKTVSKNGASETMLRDLLFAWKVVKHVKSNAVVLAADGVTVGVGAGQMNRVGAVEIALRQAGDKAKGAVLASDAFFPFSDAVQSAADAGVVAVVQPGGSMRDQESTDVADAHDMVMVHTGVRHFKH